MKSTHSTILFPILKINKHLNENNFRPNNLIIKIWNLGGIFGLFIMQTSIVVMGCHVTALGLTLNDL